MHAVLLLLSVVFLASCGGDDDGPTGPVGRRRRGRCRGVGTGGDDGNPVGQLDSRLFGTWNYKESSDAEADTEEFTLTVTFKDDGSAIEIESDAERGERQSTWWWWTENGQLVTALSGVCSVTRYRTGS